MHTITQAATLRQHHEDGRANEEWLKARQGRITGSVVGAIMGVDPYTSSTDLLRRKLWPQPRGETPLPCRWGNDNESRAEADLCNHLNEAFGRDWNIIHYGLLLHPKIEHFGYSPDGVLEIKENGTIRHVLLEYKCPFRWARRKPDATQSLYPWSTPPGGGEPVPIPPQYWLQMQFGCYILEAYLRAIVDPNTTIESALFVVWTPFRTSVRHVKYNRAYVTKTLIPLLTKWWTTVYHTAKAAKNSGRLEPGEISEVLNLAPTPDGSR